MYFPTEHTFMYLFERITERDGNIKKPEIFHPFSIQMQAKVGAVTD